MQKTKIEWADYSVNPLKFVVPEQEQPINLCVPASAGCKFCYAAAIVSRFKKVKYGNAAMKDAKPVLIKKEIQAMLSFKPTPPFKNGRERAAVFPFDMTDLFGPWVPDELIHRLFAVFALRPDVDWLILTKHPDRMGYLFADFMQEGIELEMSAVDGFPDEDYEIPWPLPNVWLGTSVENRKERWRIDALRNVPAAVRFLSLEPLLEDLGALDLDDMHQVIVGGESGQGARICNLENIECILWQCLDDVVLCYVKQLGSKPHFNGQRLKLEHSKGADLAEWPEYLRVREMLNSNVKWKVESGKR